MDRKALRSKAMKLSLVTANTASYYIMKNGYILRLEEPLDLNNIPLMIKANLIDSEEIVELTQDQANHRVAIFRDEILELEEYQERVFGLCS